MSEEERVESWRSLLSAHGAELEEFMMVTEAQQRSLAVIGINLVYCLQEWLRNEDACSTFIQSLRNAIDKCDESNYNDQPSAFAYAYVHLLERYRRMWAILTKLLRVRALPMGDERLDILDIGAGPAPSLYAAQDFYRQVDYFGALRNVKPFRISEVNSFCIEPGTGMQHVMHRLSEQRLRSDARLVGPFGAQFIDFTGLNVDDERERRKRERIREISDDDDTSEEHAAWWFNENELFQYDRLFRYRLIIFSNVLTKVSSTMKWRTELFRLFSSLRPGGVVVVTGGSGGTAGSDKDYGAVYDIVAEAATAAHLVRLEIPPVLLSDYDDSSGKLIADLRKIVWQLVEAETPPSILEQAKADPALQRFWRARPGGVPGRYGVRAFRKGK